MDMGTGKTFTDIRDTAKWVKRGLITGWIIIAPKGVYHKWQTKDMPEHATFPRREARWISGANKAQRQAIASLCSHFSPKGVCDVLYVNHEAMATIKCKSMIKEFVRTHPKFKVSIDESISIKTHDAQVSKVCTILGRKARVRRILTGFPYPKSPLDAYSQFNFLDPNILGYANYYAFRKDFAIMKIMELGPRTVKIVVGYRNQDRLRALIKPHSYRVLKSEALPELPEKTYETRIIEMSKEQATIYEDIRENSFHLLSGLEDAGKRVTTQHVLTQLIRLQQVVAGHMKTDDGLLIRLKRCPRMTALDHLLEELDLGERKVIIWSGHVVSLEDIYETVGKNHGLGSVVRYWGDVKDKERLDALDRFNHDSSCRVFVGNPATGGSGLDLVSADTTIYYTNGFNLNHRIQSEDRNHRHGFKGMRALYIDLHTPDTVDELVARANAEKLGNATRLMGDNWRKYI